MANGFLGARDYVVQAGRLPLPEAATIMLCTDGINDRRYSGTGSKKGAGQRVTEVRIAAILSGDTSPGDKANALVEASTIPDDASVIIIEHRL